MSDTELVFTNEKNIVVVMGHIVNRLIQFRQLHALTPESAGVLIGERRGMHLVVCDISEPSPKDVRQRFLVNRKGKHHQQKVDDAFHKSKGIHQYLGEWHTHPENTPSPSTLDKNSWQRNLKFKEPMIVFIVGRNGFWLGINYNNTIKQLKLLR